jgi:hypothetical protein
VILDLAQSQRYARQIALPEIGRDGQARLAEASALVVGDDRAAATAAAYLGAAGVGQLRRTPALADGPAWLAALEGAAVVVRSGLDDDPMLRAAVRLGIPAVIARAERDAVDVIAFRKHGPCPHAALDVPARAASTAADQGAAAVLAGTLAAAEALWILAEPGAPPRARHLRLPIDGGEPRTQELPWMPECFLCGGNAREAVVSP